MLKCFGRDLETIFASSDFGEAENSVTLDGAPVLHGIFDEGDVEVQIGEGVAQILPQCKFTCPSSQVPNLLKDQTMVIRGASYTVQFWKNDGVGMIEIFLEKAPS